MTARVKVHPSLFEWAIIRSGRPSYIEEKFTSLPKWMSGEVDPTLKQLEDFAKATYTPLRYFFLDSPPIEDLGVPYFRTIAGQESPSLSSNLIDTIMTMQRRQSWMKDYRLDEGFESLSFIGSVQLSDPDTEAAKKIREVFGFTETWASEHQNWENALGTLRAAAEDAGIMVFNESIVGLNTRRTLDVSECRGFVLHDEFAPLIFINGNDGKAAQMFTLAHEIAHLFLGKSAIFDLNKLKPATDPYERKCNAIAAEFLVPALRLLDLKHESIQKIAKTFKVSELVAAYRMLDLHIISPREFDAFYTQYYTQYTENREKERAKNRENERGGPSPYVVKKSQISQIFSFAVISAVREGNLLYRDAYHLIGMHGASFDKYVEELGR